MLELLKLLLKCKKFEKSTNTKKLRIIVIFPTTYHLYHSDKRLRNAVQFTVRPYMTLQISVFLKLLLNDEEFGETVKE